MLRIPGTRLSVSLPGLLIMVILIWLFVDGVIHRNSGQVLAVLALPALFVLMIGCIWICQLKYRRAGEGLLRGFKLAMRRYAASTQPYVGPRFCYTYTAATGWMRYPATCDHRSHLFTVEASCGCRVALDTVNPPWVGQVIECPGHHRFGPVRLATVSNLVPKYSDGRRTVFANVPSPGARP